MCGGVEYISEMVDERTVIYPTIVGAGVKVVILNGEADTCVPITDNQVRGVVSVWVVSNPSRMIR